MKKTSKLDKFLVSQYASKAKTIRATEFKESWFYADPSTISIYCHVEESENPSIKLIKIPRALLKEYIERTENLC